MFERASADDLAVREKLASRVRNELAAAGLPVLAPGLDPGWKTTRPGEDAS